MLCCTEVQKQPPPPTSTEPITLTTVMRCTHKHINTLKTSYLYEHTHIHFTQGDSQALLCCWRCVCHSNEQHLVCDEMRARARHEVSLLKRSMCSKEVDLVKFKEFDNVNTDNSWEMSSANLKTSSRAPKGTDRGSAGQQMTVMGLETRPLTSGWWAIQESKNKNIN